MTEDTWDTVLARIPAPFRGRVELCRNAAVLIQGRTAKILASVQRKRDGYEHDHVVMSRWPWPSVRLEESTTEKIAQLLTDAAFDAVLESLPLPKVPPLELDNARECVYWAPTGERMAFLAGFEDVADLKWYATRITAFKYRVALADALREAVKGRSVTVTWGAEEIIVRRQSRAVVIHAGGGSMASILLRGGRYGDRGRTVVSADYGVLRDEDLIAPAVSFLRFED